jgi:AraC-like DNA-binding protein
MARVSFYGPEDLIRLAEKAEFRLKEFSKLVEASPQHLNRIVHRLFGKSLEQWLMALAMEAAVQKLRAGAMVKQAALGSGFKSSNNFSAKFKKLRGMSPSEYQAMVHREAALGSPAPPPTPRARRAGQ